MASRFRPRLVGVNDHTEWLLTQIDADEQQAHEHIAYWGKPTEGRPLAGDEYDCMSIGSDRVLAECEAKRRIIAIHGEGGDPCDAHDPITLKTVPCDTLRAQTLPYASRPGIRPEWLPNGGDQ